MEKKKRPFVGFTLLLIIVGTVILMTSLATDYWVCVHPKLLIEGNTTDIRRYGGSIHYGLFRGGIMLNYGLGDRLSNIIGEKSTSFLLIIIIFFCFLFRFC